MRKLRWVLPNRSWIVVVILVFGYQTIHAGGGDRSNIVGLGMGRTYTATSRGVDALGINPANLAVPGDKSFTLSILPVGVRLGTDFLDYDLYRQYFTGDRTQTGRVGHYLTESDKSLILSRFSSGMGTVNADADVKLFGLSLQGSTNSFGFAITEKVGAVGTFSKDYLKFLFYGNSPGQSFNFSNTEIRGWWLREYSVSYARGFDDALGLNFLSVGIAAKLVNGFGYFDVERMNSSFTTSSQDVVTGHVEFVSHRSGADFFNSRQQASFTPFPSPSGKGWGLDFGINAKLRSGLNFGLSLTDLGTLAWNHNARERCANGDFTLDDAFSKSQRDSLERVLEGHDQKVSTFTTQLPTAIHFGIALALGQSESPETALPLVIGFDYNQGLNDMPGNSQSPRISFGAELRALGWLPLRSGFSIGGSEGRNWAFGLGLHIGPITLDVATENVLSILQPSRANRVSAGMGARLVF